MMVMLIGFAAQSCFFARALVQWIMSEKAHRVLSPTAFWVLSACGSFMFGLYGWLRQDFAIILGQLINFYIYLWNLRIKGVLRHAPRPLRWLLFLLPVILVAVSLKDAAQVVENLFRSEELPWWKLTYGSVGMLLLSVRFIYQWFYSRRRMESELPGGFWAISICGAVIVCTYGIMRMDPVLMLGQGFGLLVYSRNLYLWIKHNNHDRNRTSAAAD